MIKSPKKGRGQRAVGIREDNVFPLPLGFEAPKFIYENYQRIFSETFSARKKASLLNRIYLLMEIPPVLCLLPSAFLRRFWLLNLFALCFLSGCSGQKTPNFLQMVSEKIERQKVKIPEIPAEAAQPPQAPTSVSLTPEQEQQIGLKRESVELQPFRVTLLSTGRVQAAGDSLAHISPPVPGKVTTVFVELGQRVRKGQTLALVKSDAIGQIESDLLQASLQNQADLKQAQVQLNFSKAVYERELKLFGDRISAKADLEAARTQYEKDVANLQAVQTKLRSAITVAEERLSLAGATVGVAEQVVHTGHISPNFIVTAPRDGVIISRTINLGELADPSKELFTLADLSRVWLVADAYEQDINKIRLGQPVQVTLDSIPNKVFSGKINYVADTLDPQTRTLTIKADVPNPGLNLKPDMFARLQVLVDNANILTVPRSAVVRNGDNNYVYVETGEHRYEERLVKLGDDNGQSTQVINGLKLGETIVTKGTLALQGTALKAKDGG
ncbi:MAG: efflux RND transporter periplasmic adaptor subunit [Rhizonema sp. PD37]|nr:efflux RND transporter periplasmic adaptor subunit [Rhizonema sp. PD37]